jgi:uncharacterized protein
VNIKKPVIVAVMAITLGGCAGAMAGLQDSLRSMTGPQLAENGLELTEYSLRNDLVAGRADSVLFRLTERENGTPNDELLEGLYVGIAASYAGDYLTSQRALQAAADLAEDRYTKSISEGMTALLTSDNALGYMPGQTERLFIHYYGMMNFAEQGDARSAAIEARRIGNLLQRYDEQQDTVDISTRAALRYIAGAAFEAAGERNDADVSYRNAFALLGDDAPSRLPALTEARSGEGTVLVVVEKGFVAHRVATPLMVSMAEGEAAAFKGSDVADHLKVAAALAARVTLGLASEPDAALYWRGPDYKINASNAGRAAYILSLSWPTYHRPPPSQAKASVEMDGVELSPVFVAANVSNAIVGDFQRARTAMLARTIARAGVKMFAAEQASKRLGPLAGVAANLGAGMLERADTRCWHMLPNELGIARITLPAGTHSGLRVRVASANGGGQELDLGEIHVPESGTTVVRLRAF